MNGFVIARFLGMGALLVGSIIIFLAIKRGVRNTQNKHLKWAEHLYRGFIACLLFSWFILPFLIASGVKIETCSLLAVVMALVQLGSFITGNILLFKYFNCKERVEELAN